MKGPKNNLFRGEIKVDTGMNDAFYNQQIKETAERIMDNAIRQSEATKKFKDGGKEHGTE